MVLQLHRAGVKQCLSLHCHNSVSDVVQYLRPLPDKYMWGGCFFVLCLKMSLYQERVITISALSSCIPVSAITGERTLCQTIGLICAVIPEFLEIRLFG